MKRSKILKKEGSIRNIIRLLVLEVGIILMILYISLRYGEKPELLAIITLSVIAVVNIFTAIVLWKLREKN